MNVKDVGIPLRQALAATLMLALGACGGSNSPTAPTTPPANRPQLTAPSVDSPVSGSQVNTLRPTLTVNNGGSSQPGALTYEFQVANNSQFLGGGSNVLLSQANVPEGSTGKTSTMVPADLATSTVYYWRARVTQSGFSSSWSGSASFTTSSEGNQPPVLRSLVTRGPQPGAPSGFADLDEDLEVIATVEDRETAPENLVYEWAADAGSISGSGATIRWRAPRPATTPSPVTIRLTVIERYRALDASGVVVDREHRTFGSVVVSVHDSLREIADLATLFLTEFSNSSIPAETVVRNFSDSCPGKAAELTDIRNNRINYLITGSKLGTPKVSVRFDASVCGDRQRLGDGCAEMTCEWTSRVLTGSDAGKIETARGTCVMSVVYERSRWLLCDSDFYGTTASGSLWLR